MTFSAHHFYKKKLRTEGFGKHRTKSSSPFLHSKKKNLILLGMDRHGSVWNGVVIIRKNPDKKILSIPSSGPLF